MSQLHIRAEGYVEHLINVLSFSSPIFASTNSSQTQDSTAHFPIKANQPDVRFDVLFASQKDHRDWQDFVRKLQKDALTTDGSDKKGQVTLWWPERNILNWSGLIKETDAGAERFDWTPHAVIDVLLINSLISQQTFISSFASNFWAVVGPDNDLAGVSGFKPPTAPIAQSDPLKLGAGANAYDPRATISPTAPNAQGGLAGSVGTLFPQAVAQ